MATDGERKKAPRSWKKAPRSSPDLARVAELAQFITGSRAQLANAFQLAQTRRREVLEFEALFPVPDDAGATAAAFERAAREGWLVELCVACIDARIVGPRFLEIVGTVTGDAGLLKLQTIVDKQHPYIDSVTFSQRLPWVARQVCRVEIDGIAKGTGFLIRPDLVVTTYHVVRTLLDAENNACEGAGQRLRLRFDFFRTLNDGAIHLGDGTVCRVADNWLAAASPCHTEELLNRLPEDLATLDACLDFALIRLAESPGIGRNGFALAPELGIVTGDFLLIPQHPGGRAQVFNMGKVVGMFPNAPRFLHVMNTEHGSSGSPCLSRDFEVVGLHQAGFDDSAHRIAAHDKDKRENRLSANRGVPIAPVHRKLGNLPPTDPTFTPLATLLDPPRHPVFGRYRLQSWAWNSIKQVAPGGRPASRILAVTGALGTGKTFTADVLRTLLPPADHALIRLDAGTFHKDTALAFTERLLKPLGGGAAALPSRVDANTTLEAWLGTRFVPDLFAEIECRRAGRAVWLVLDQLDDVRLPDNSELRPFLDLIYARVEMVEWLRIVLLGFSGLLAARLEPLVTREKLDRVTVDEIMDWLNQSNEHVPFALEEPRVRGLVQALLISADGHPPRQAERIATLMLASGLVGGTRGR